MINFQGVGIYRSEIFRFPKTKSNKWCLYILKIIIITSNLHIRNFKIPVRNIYKEFSIQFTTIVAKI